MLAVCFWNYRHLVNIVTLALCIDVIITGALWKVEISCMILNAKTVSKDVQVTESRKTLTNKKKEI